MTPDKSYACGAGRWSVALLSAFAIVAAGCGGQVVAVGEAESGVKEQLERVLNIRADAVECPEDVKVELGNQFDCTVTPASGPPLIASLKITTVNADVELIGVEKQ